MIDKTAWHGWEFQLPNKTVEIYVMKHPLRKQPGMFMREQKESASRFVPLAYFRSEESAAFVMTIIDTLAEGWKEREEE